MTNKTSNGPRLIGEDAKLDALLLQARPTPDAAREAALLDRILAAAERSPRLTATVSAPSTAAAAPAALPMANLRRPARDLWGAGGLMAASLVAGLLFGQSSYSDPAARRIEQATGITMTSASQEVALSLASAELDEDDL